MTLSTIDFAKIPFAGTSRSKLYDLYAQVEGEGLNFVKIRPGKTSYKTTTGNLVGQFVSQNSNVFYVDDSEKLYNSANATTSTLSNIFLGNGLTWSEGDQTLIYIHGGSPVSGSAYSDYVCGSDPTGVWTITEITDSDHPIKAGFSSPPGVVWLDGYFFVAGVTSNGDSRIYNSDLNSATSWTSTGYINSYLEGDPIRYIAKHRNHVVAFSKNSIEFFYDAGNPTGSPLNRRQDIFYNIGLYNYITATNTFNKDRWGWVPSLDDTLFFIGGKHDSILGVYKLENFQLIKISTQPIDDQLSNGAYIKGLLPLNKGMLVVKGFNISGTFVYDLELDTWYHWSEEYSTGIADYYISNNGTTLYTFGGNHDGTWEIWTPIIKEIPGITTKSNIGRKKFCSSLQVDGYRPSSTANLSVSWSDDNYNSFTTARTLDFSKTDYKLTRLGSFEERAFKITGTTTNELAHLILDITVGVK